MRGTEMRSPQSLRWTAAEKSRSRPVRRPRTSFATSHSGGVGAPPGWPLRAACQELADDPTESRTKARPDAETRTPRWSAERRAPFAKGAPPDAVEHAQTAQACLLAAVGAPLGAPLPLLFKGEVW